MTHDSIRGWGEAAGGGFQKTGPTIVCSKAVYSWRGPLPSPPLPVQRQMAPVCQEGQRDRPLSLALRARAKGLTGTPWALHRGPFLASKIDHSTPKGSSFETNLPAPEGLLVIPLMMATAGSNENECILRHQMADVL